MHDGGLKETLKLDMLEQMSCLISAAMHDYEHPGVNSAFLVNMNDEMATMHNDKSVLENHHLASSFMIMQRDASCNWAASMPQLEYQRARQVIISTILATDMSRHFEELGHCSSLMSD